MRKYESIVVVSPLVNQNEQEAVRERIRSYIESAGGEGIHVEEWGKRRIPHRTRKGKFEFGFYYCFYFDSDNNEAPRLLADELRLLDEVIKFQTHRIFTAVRKFKGDPRKVRRKIREAAEENRRYGNSAV